MGQVSHVRDLEVLGSWNTRVVDQQVEAGVSHQLPHLGGQDGAGGGQDGAGGGQDGAGGGQDGAGGGRVPGLTCR